jgi:hypothetical protein
MGASGGAEWVPASAGESTTASGDLSDQRFVLCPKCQARNDPASRRCAACRADLLPGRSGRERLGYTIVGIIFAAAVMALAVAMASQHAEVPLCANPISLGFFSLALLFGSLGYGLGRTPEYEKYLNRAQRHLQAAPEQALADLNKALELAPQKLHSRILKQRGELLSRLGRAEEALDDLTAHAAAPEKGGLSWLVSGVSDIDVEASTDQSTLAEINRLQKQLVESGARERVGYCKTCRTAVSVDANQQCANCGAKIKDVRLVRPGEREAALSGLNREQAARRRKRSLRTALVVVALFLCVGLPLAAVVIARLVPQVGTRPTPTPRSATSATPGLFEENVFSFSYPSDWKLIGPQEVASLLKTSLQGMSSSSYSYIGGVYSGGLDSCKGCAQVVLVVATNASLTGTLTDPQYQAFRAASEQQMGARLLSHRKIEVASMPAAESIHLGLSGDSKLWEYIIVPPKPGVAYLVSCSSHKDSFASFESAFQQIMDSLQIEGAAARSTPTRAPAVTPLTPVSPVAGTTYTVKSGDTLGQIAKSFGLTVEALAQANGIADPNLIRPGQVLTIPVAAP